VATSGQIDAYWSGSGSGSGSAVHAAAAAVVLSPGTPTAALYPGGQSAVALTASNPNPFEVHIGALGLATTQGTGGFAVDAGHAGCSVTSVSYVVQTNGGIGWTVPAKVGAVNGVLPMTLGNAVAMAASSPSACQGATLTTYLTAGP
jgi:hypothetical protein